MVVSSVLRNDGKKSLYSQLYVPFDGFQSLRYRTDLIQFDQNRISAAKADTFLKGALYL